MTTLLFLLGAAAAFAFLGYLVPIHKVENAASGIGSLITTFGVPLGTHYLRVQAQADKARAALNAANGVPTAVDPLTDTLAQLPHPLVMFGACIIGLCIGAWRREVTLAARGLKDDPLS